MKYEVMFGVPIAALLIALAVWLSAGMYGFMIAEHPHIPTFAIWWVMVTFLFDALWAVVCIGISLWRSRSGE